MIRKILEIRDNPPDHLRRVPGPVAIRYYLEQDALLKASALRIPTSTSTIWRILDQYHRIPRSERHPHEGVDRPQPMDCWQMDFKDVSTVRPDEEGKQQHVVETLNFVDEGTSIVVGAVVRTDFTMETAIWGSVEVLLQRGLPDRIQFDRDARFVGSWSGRDFPSPFVRFWQTLDVQVTVCPPQRPDKNGFVERYHRSYNAECIQIDRPDDFDTALEATARYVRHYNEERPNQALSCGNRPPLDAFPNLPTLPKLPQRVDPDAWLNVIDGIVYTRRIDAKGNLKLGEQRYYIRAALRGQYVNVRVLAGQRQLEVEHHGQRVRVLNIKGLVGHDMDFDAYFEWIMAEARTHWRRLHRPRR